MVSKNSEYRRQYKKTNLIKNIPTYYEHVSYRNHRRELESAHTPISWGVEVEDTVYLSDAADEEEAVDKLSLEKLKIAEEEEEKAVENKNEEIDIEQKLTDKNKCSASKNEVTDKNVDKKISDDIIIDIKSPEQQTLTKLAKAKLNKYASKENKDLPEQRKPDLQKDKDLDGGLLQPKKVDDKTFVHKSKPRRPDRDRPKSSSPRPVSASTSSILQQDQPEYRPPFCAYGGGNHASTTGQQKTYNVRASKQIYPAAVKAHQKQIEAERRRKSSEKKAVLREKRKKALLAEKMARETASWQSEYCRNYPTYDSTEYERNCTSRNAKRRTHFMILW